MTWQEQLEEVVVDKMFGTNTEWHIKDVRKYITKLEDLGAWDIKILDLDSLSFTLPVGEAKADLLLYIMTHGRMPSSVDYNKKKRTVRLNWDW